MQALINAVEAFARAVGAWGLFVIAFLDSSFLSFPQANDLLIVWMVLQRRELMPLYAAMATAGSIGGCLVLYATARKGGEAMLKRRFHERHIERGLALFRRYGVLAILVPSILPPPAPFKLFVLMAGVAAMPAGKFAGAVASGRGLRYFAIGILTLWYGEAAVAFLKTNGRVIALVAAIAALIGGALVIHVRNRARRSGGTVATSGRGPV